MEMQNWPDWTYNAGAAQKTMGGRATAKERTTSLSFFGPSYFSFFFSFCFFVFTEIAMLLQIAMVCLEKSTA
jgi:hypothetical protein